MNMYWKRALGMLLLTVFWALAGYAQKTKSAPKPGDALKIEGQVTEVQMSPAQGPPTLSVKTGDGKLYAVHIGPQADLKRQGFAPKVGDKITVTGTFCCEMHGQTMVHSTELILAGKTFRTPAAAAMQGPQSGSQGGPQRGPMTHPGIEGMSGHCCMQGVAGCCGQGCTPSAGGCPCCQQ